MRVPLSWLLEFAALEPAGGQPGIGLSEAGLSGAVAAEVGAKPGQVALAWLLAKGDDIAPIPGTKRVAHLEENVAADGIELSQKCPGK